MPVVDVTSFPWVDSGDIPPHPLDRPPQDIISQPITDPLYDYTCLPLTYTNSRWSAFFYRADEKDLKRLLPPMNLTLEDDVVEFWYVEHYSTMLGPYGEFGVTVAASCKGDDGNTYYGGYYPYMYLTGDSGIFAGREPFGFPKKAAYITCLEHGGKLDDGYGDYTNRGGEYWSFMLERRSYVLHTATGKYDDEALSAKPAFYGDVRYGRMNMRIHTSPDVKKTDWDLTYIASDWPPGSGKHRFQVKPESIRTASPKAIRSWYMGASPFDNMAALVPAKELIGLMTFSFDLIIPAGKNLVSKTVERSDDDIMKHLVFSQYGKYSMRQRFPIPVGV
jgi:hypothetical protein